MWMRGWTERQATWGLTALPARTTGEGGCGTRDERRWV